MKTEVSTNLTIKQEVTAVVTNIVKNDNAKALFFSQTLKRIREAGTNEQLQGAIVTAIDSELKTLSASANNKKVAKNILTTAKNYHTLGLILAFDKVEYNNTHAIVGLLTKIKATEGDTVGYKADKDSDIVQVDKEGALTTIQTSLSLVFKSEVLKGLKDEAFKITYNDLLNEQITTYAKQYGKKVAEEEFVKSYYELMEEATAQFVASATDNEIEVMIKKLQLTLDNSKERAKQLKTA